MQECTCIYQPMGDNGLEGYLKGDTYLFEIITGTRSSIARVYFKDDLENYQICGVNTFNKYFIKNEKNS